MTDRKSLAAGEEDWEPYLQEPEIPAFPEVIDHPGMPEPLDHGRIVECDRCGTQKAYFDRCSGCPEFDQKLCVCGHKAVNHSDGRGSRTNAKIWVCRGCMSVSA